MDRRAFIFPGQGSQTVGMGRALAENFPAARRVFQEVDDALSEKLSQMIFEGPEEALTLTANTQPALMAVSLAVMAALEGEGVRLADVAAFAAGHSLGEYSALAAAGSIGLADTARLLRIRGNAMQKAVPPGIGAMAALLGADFEQAKAIAAEAAGPDICSAANDNAPGQVVISGHKAAVERAMEIAKAKGIRRAVLLPVSAPFHSPLMAPAAEVMADALADVAVRTPVVPVVANVAAVPVTAPDDIRRLLVEQVTGTVRWRESIVRLAGDGVSHFVEAGAGKVLAGLVKRIAPEAQAASLGTPEDVAAFLGTLK